MNFDFAIGTPPYQDNHTQGDSKFSYAPPVYHLFMDAAFNVASKAQLITPARFLFNAGATPKEWNKKMLNNPHFKVLKYFQKSILVFPETNIGGGVIIGYYDRSKEFGVIGLFTGNPILTELAHKVREHPQFTSLSDCMYSSYTFTHLIHQAHPEIVERYPELRNRYNLATNIFTKLENLIFFKQKPNDEQDYVQIYGILNNKRQYMWINKEYIRSKQNWTKYKLFVPAIGPGALGEKLSTLIIGTPMVGYTQSFISIGAFDSEQEAEHCLKYVKTKFARTMLGVLKITQSNKRSTWSYVPWQDFSVNSDLDWSSSVNEIDQQLYAKYNLNNEEIEFIENNAKPML